MNKRYFYGEVDYSSLVKARNTLNRILQTSRNEAEKMGVVKAFEICYELSWKIMKKILEFRGVEAGAARDGFSGSGPLKIAKRRRSLVHLYHQKKYYCSCLPTRNFRRFICQYRPRIFTRLRLFIDTNRKRSP